jgi:hypothetical protein
MRDAKLRTKIWVAEEPTRGGIEMRHCCHRFRRRSLRDLDHCSWQRRSCSAGCCIPVRSTTTSARANGRRNGGRLRECLNGHSEHPSVPALHDRDRAGTCCSGSRRSVVLVRSCAAVVSRCLLGARARVRASNDGLATDDWPTATVPCQARRTHQREPSTHPPVRDGTPGWSPWAERERSQRELDDIAASADEGDVRMVYVPVAIGQIIQRLSRDAVKNSDSAARELREWLKQYPPQDEGFDPGTLDRALRQKIYARLVAEVEAEEAAASLAD